MCILIPGTVDRDLSGVVLPFPPTICKVSLLRELSLADFHAAYGWEDSRSPQSGTRLQRGDPSHASSTASGGPGLISPAYASPPVTAYGSNEAREVSWGQDVGQEGTPRGAPAVSARRDGQHGERWDRGRDSATSGLGFMSALQRALVRPRPGPEAGGDKEGRETTCDRHALELLSTLAACCEVFMRTERVCACVSFFLLLCAVSADVVCGVWVCWRALFASLCLSEPVLGRSRR